MVGGGGPGSGGQAVVERGEQQDDVAEAGRVAHAADAPGLPGELAEAAADLDAVAVEELAAQLGVVDAVGQPRGGELGQPVALGGEERENPSSGSAVLQGRAARGVPRPGGLEPLVEQRAEPGVQRETIEIGAVWWYARRTRRRSRRSGRGRGTTTARASATAPLARPASEKVTGGRPGGTPRHFCVPE